MGKAAKHKPGKLGRNEPCFCGSGFKYKKCCLLQGLKPPQQITPPEAMAHFHQAEAKRHLWESKGIYINIPNTTTFQGKSMMGVGSRILWQPRPHLTFHQMIMYNLTMTLGKEWWDEQTALPPVSRHFIRRCFDEIKDNPPGAKEDFQQITDTLHTFVATGNLLSMLSLAFDVYALMHHNALRDDWLDRLKRREEYQGVRYEIAVAAMFVRIGCELEFYPPEKPRRHRAEFIAHHPQLNLKVAVEAKSRHRSGVIHQEGELNQRKAAKGDIQRLFNDALKKETDDLPYLIFIDVNAPTNIDPSIIRAKWFADVQKMFDHYDEPTVENPQSYNALFTTNYSYHYDANDVTHAGQYGVALGLHAEYPLEGGIENPLIQRLLQAAGGYGYVPNV
jgi:hypothetical protein